MTRLPQDDPTTDELVAGEDPTPPDVRAGGTAEVAPAAAEPAPQEVREVETKLRVHGLFKLPELTEAEGVAQVLAQAHVRVQAPDRDQDQGLDLRVLDHGHGSRSVLGRDLLMITILE